VATQSSTPWVARPSRGRTALLVGLVVLTVATLAVGGVVWWLDRAVDRVGVDGLGEGNGISGGDEDGDDDDPSGSGGIEDDTDPDALTVLVLGSDSREVLTEEERRELGTGYAAGERTEVVALVRLDPAVDEVRILSVPRDSLVTRCDGSDGRVNAAHHIGERDGIGGITCVVETLRDWLGVRIDHALMVDFRGFVDIVDAVGGVTVHTDEPLQDDRANLDLDAGCNRLDGASALAFVRARQIDSDFGRMQRQHEFAVALRDELAEQGVLTDLRRLLRVAEATARAVELDDGLTIGRIQQLARLHRGTIRGEIDGRSIPGEIETIDGFAFVRPDEQRATELTRWLVTGRDIAEIRDDLLDDEDEAAGDEAAGLDEQDGPDARDGADDADPDGREHGGHRQGLDAAEDAADDDAGRTSTRDRERPRC
jgi:LCP family protein required for cell wall assembly